MFTRPVQCWKDKLSFVTQKAVANDRIVPRMSTHTRISDVQKGFTGVENQLLPHNWRAGHYQTAPRV